jgi:hypothetical protein
VYDLLIQMKEQIKRITEERINPEEKIEKTVTISFDGDQFLVRIPKKISDLLEMKKGDKVKFLVNIPYIEESKKKYMVVELID